MDDNGGDDDDGDGDSGDGGDDGDDGHGDGAMVGVDADVVRHRCHRSVLSNLQWHFVQTICLRIKAVGCLYEKLRTV